MTTAGYATLVAAARRRGRDGCAARRIALVTEGGYHLPALARVPGAHDRVLN